MIYSALTSVGTFVSDIEKRLAVAEKIYLCSSSTFYHSTHVTDVSTTSDYEKWMDTTSDCSTAGRSIVCVPNSQRRIESHGLCYRGVLDELSAKYYVH